MKSSTHKTQKLQPRNGLRGFTLMETVIAILVLAVLLTGFLTVFTPAAQGIRRSISTQQADRLQATLERDMSTLRIGETVKEKTTSFVATTGFDKAFIWIKEGNVATKVILVYQYRGNAKLAPRADGTLQPMEKIDGKPGIDYVTQSSARRLDPSDTNYQFLLDDLNAIVGPVFYVIPTQLVTESNQLVLGTPGKIFNPIAPPATSKLEAATPSAYTEAVIPFSAAFFMTPSVSAGYLTGKKFEEKFNLAAAADSKVKPVFIRNLAVRR